jgi:hypothetical protein
MSIHGEILEGVKPSFHHRPKGKPPVPWGRNWRKRIAEARALVARAKKLDAFKGMKRRHLLSERAHRLLDGVVRWIPERGGAAQWRAVGTVRAQLLKLVETCLGCAACENVPCRLRVHLSARATRALFELVMREGDRKLAKVAKGVMVDVSEDAIIGELLVREAKRLGPRRRSKRGKRS